MFGSNFSFSVALWTYIIYDAGVSVEETSRNTQGALNQPKKSMQVKEKSIYGCTVYHSVIHEP